MKKIALLIVIVLTSCAIEDTIARKDDPLSIEANIKEGKFAEVRLTNSINFSGIIDSLEIAKSVESKAKVSISDGTNSEILTLKKDENRFPFFFYQGTVIKGEIGKLYNLSITINNNTYHSTTSIPNQPEIINIDFVTANEEGNPTPDFKDIILTIKNDINTTNYFKILIKNENDSKFRDATPFLFNTENINTAEFPIVVSYSKFENDTKINLLETNATFELQLIQITKEQFSFWKSIKDDETILLSGASLTNEVNSNISNNAFGYWSGENPTAIKFIVPE